jgi:hypothetical protein
MFVSKFVEEEFTAFENSVLRQLVTNTINRREMARAVIVLISFEIN